MKALTRLFPLALLVGAFGALTGCTTSSQQYSARRIEPVNDFEVVETSAKRPLTGKEMAELRKTVAGYLDREGAEDTGDYYLKVYLTAEEEGVTPEWVVVRFTRYTDTRVSVASAEPANVFYDPLYSPYYSYDLYPYGYYGGFNRISFQYYDSPFYGRRYNFPRRGDHRGDNHDRDHDHRPDGVNHGNRPPYAVHPNGTGVVTAPTPFTPRPGGNRPPNVEGPRGPRPANQVGGRPDWHRDGNGQNRRPTPVATPPANRPSSSNPPANQPQRQWRGRNEGNASVPRLAPSAPRSEARAPVSAAPRIAPSAPSPQRSAPSGGDRPSGRGGESGRNERAP